MLDALIDSMSDFVFYKNKDGVYLICNEAFARDFVGLPKDQIVGRNDLEVFGSSDQEKLNFILARDREVFEKNVEIKVNWETKLSSGRVVSLETVKTPFRDKTGLLVGLVGVSRDVTDRIKTERDITEQMRQLEVMNRLMVDRELKMIELKKELEKVRGVSAIHE